MKQARPKRTRLRGKSKPSDGLPRLSAEDRSSIQNAIKYEFGKPVLLDQAMTHPGRLRGQESLSNNQRLEFLGDRVLGLVIADSLFERYPNERESGLAPRLNKLVNRDACVNVARAINLPNLLLVSPADERNGVREKPSVGADAIEAVIGAVYLDADFETARAVVLRLWSSLLSDVQTKPRDPKSRLQEWAQARGFAAPVYTVLSQTGPDHKPEFTVRTEIETGEHAVGQGASKQVAQSAAARELLKVVTIGASDV